MGITQFYKSQFQVAGNLFPVAPGGGSLDWPINNVVPMIAGNYWQINYIEGLQTPVINTQVPLLDGIAVNCPISTSFIVPAFMTRSADYQHDTTALGTVNFFDGFSGYGFTGCKANSFVIGGAKGDDVRFSMSSMCYGSIPSASTGVPNSGYPNFSGAPIRFQSLSFFSGSGGTANTPLNGVMSFNISFTNNCTPDLSMVGSGPQSVFPVDVNAGIQTCSAQFTFQAHTGGISPNFQHLQSGMTIRVQVNQGAVTTNFTLNNIIVDTGVRDRGIGTGRQTRPYNLIVAGISNSSPPLTIN